MSRGARAAAAIGRSPLTCAVSLRGDRREVPLPEARGEGRERPGRYGLAGDAQHAVVVEPGTVQDLEPVAGSAPPASSGTRAVRTAGSRAAARNTPGSRRQRRRAMQVISTRQPP